MSEDENNQQFVRDPSVPLFHTAQLLKHDINECKSISVSLLNVDDISSDKAKEIVPDSLYNFLKMVIDGPGLPQSTANKNKDDTKVLSLAQDFIYVATHGHVVTRVVASE